MGMGRMGRLAIAVAQPARPGRLRSLVYRASRTQTTEIRQRSRNCGRLALSIQHLEPGTCERVPAQRVAVNHEFDPSLHRKALKRRRGANETGSITAIS
jgi:hypothetical protein